MSRISELISQLCPNGVTYLSLGEIATSIYRGSGIKKDQTVEKGIPCVRYGEIYTSYNVWFDKCNTYTLAEYISSPRYFEHGDILFAITGESVDEIAKSIAYVGHDRCLAGGDIVVMKHNQDPKYLGYVLSTPEAQKQKSKGKVKSKVVHSSVPAIKEIRVPIPPIAIQQEIVHILDSFSAINNNIEEEIIARTKQFIYYRDSLIESQKKWESLSIADVIQSLKTGMNPRKNFVLNAPGASLPYITGKDIFDNGINPSEKTDLITQETVDLINRRACLEEGNVLFASTGCGTVGRMAVIDEYNGKWNISETLYSLKPKKELIVPHYLLHALTSRNAVLQYEPNITVGSVPHLKIIDLLKVKIPVPPIDEQIRITHALDSFQFLLQSLSDELTLRKKQYAFYRDTLFSFKEA